jgi:hypothetical protein
MTDTNQPEEDFHEEIERIQAGILKPAPNQPAPAPATETQTPRTDQLCGWPVTHYGPTQCDLIACDAQGKMVHADFARTLEIELAAAKALAKANELRWYTVQGAAASQADQIDDMQADRDALQRRVDVLEGMFKAQGHALAAARADAETLRKIIRKSYLYVLHQLTTDEEVQLGRDLATHGSLEATIDARKERTP